MNSDLKKFLVVFGGGILLFMVFKKLKPYGGKSKSSSSKSSSVVVTDEQKKNGAIVLKAFGDAQKGGENKAFLDEMNAEFAKTYGLRVLPNKATGTLIATDLQGNKVM
jgi:hypothetical protein